MGRSPGSLKAGKPGVPSSVETERPCLKPGGKTTSENCLLLRVHYDTHAHTHKHVHAHTPMANDR